LIEEKYPNYESVIPLDNDKRLVVDKNQLLSSVRRTSLYASTTTHQVRFSLKKNQVTVSAEDVDFGSEAKETLQCDYAYEVMEIGFNSAYIMDILSHIDTDEVEFSFSTATRAAVVKPATQHEGEELLMLVMPVRLNA
jgi:DNA polymerase-3 subunit beta